MMKYPVYLSLILLLACNTITNNNDFPELKGEYLGQNQPKDSAELFAPDIISTGVGERDFAMTPDGKEIYFCREVGNFHFATIFVTKLVNNTWTKPEVLDFCRNPAYVYIEPHISADGKKLFFISDMPGDTAIANNTDIWVCNREGDKWGVPNNLGLPVNSFNRETFPSVTDDGTLYFSRVVPELKDELVYRSKFVDGKYADPEKVDGVNVGRARFNALIARDESYIIIPVYGMPDTYGGTDYYIIFRNSNDEWSQPINMGPSINSNNLREWSPAISPDGKFIFYMSAKTPNKKHGKELTAKEIYNLHNSPQNGNSDIYWVSSGFIQKLEEKAVFSE